MKRIEWIENIKEFLLQLLDENKSKKLKSILTEKPLVYYFWDDFSEKFMQKRVDRSISLQSLRLTEKNFDTQKHKNYSGYLKEIKHVKNYENIDGDVIFLQDEKVCIFYIEEMITKIFEEQEIFQKYNEIFEKYWK